MYVVTTISYNSALTFKRGEECQIKGDDQSKSWRVHGASREAKESPRGSRARQQEETSSHGSKWQSIQWSWQGKVGEIACLSVADIADI